jgi:hypothetical protein
MNRTLLDERFRIHGRKTYYVEVRDIQRDRDRSLEFYNLKLPRSAVNPLRTQLASTLGLFEEDRLQGRPGVSLPESLARKYPTASR